MLPGEPLSPAQSNAAAKVATIAGAYQVKRWLDQTFFDPQDWSELNPEQLEFLSDWSVEREDCSRDAIEDALWRFVRYENLSAEVCSGSTPLVRKPPSLSTGASGSALVAPAATCKATSACMVRLTTSRLCVLGPVLTRLHTDRSGRRSHPLVRKLACRLGGRALELRSCKPSGKTGGFSFVRTQ